MEQKKRHTTERELALIVLADVLDGVSYRNNAAQVKATAEKYGVSERMVYRALEEIRRVVPQTEWEGQL